MNKLFVPVVVLLVCAFIMSGCSTSTSSTTPTTPTSTTPTVSTPTVAVSTPAPGSPTVTAPVSNTPVVTTSTPMAGTPTYGGTLRIATASSPSTPIGYPAETSGGSVQSMQFCEETLLKEELGGKLDPRLATSYDVNTSADAPSITFHLRQGVKFSDGTDFNAQAAKWNLDTLKNGHMYDGDTVFWKSTDVVDDYTLRLNLTEWRNTLIRGLSDSMGYMVSPTAFQKNGIDWMRWNMVGTGAFTQINFQRDVSLTATRNSNYWDQGKPYLDSVQLLYVTDELTAEALFQSGGADILGSTSKVAYDLQNKGYKTVKQTGGATVLVPDSVNADSPWSNIKVRQAAEYAIDKAAIVKAYGYGFFQVAYQLPSPAINAYDPNFSGTRVYDVAKAKQLLADAGYPNGFKTAIICNPQGLNKDIAVVLQSYLGAIGIQVDLQFPQAAAFQQFNTGTWHNALLLTGQLEWANFNNEFVFYFGEPGSFYKSLKHPDGWGAMLSTSMHSPLASTAIPTGDPALIQKLVRAAYDDAMVIPLYYGASVTVVTDKVQDTGLGTRGSSIYWNPAGAWLSK